MNKPTNQKNIAAPKTFLACTAQPKIKAKFFVPPNHLHTGTSFRTPPASPHLSCYSGLSPDHCFPEYMPACSLLSLSPSLPCCGQACLQATSGVFPKCGVGNDTPLLKTPGLISSLTMMSELLREPRHRLHGLVPIILLCPCTMDACSPQTRNSTPAPIPYTYLDTLPQILV